MIKMHISLLTEKKSFRLSLIMEMSTSQCHFALEAYQMDLVLLSPEKYL